MRRAAIVVWLVVGLLVIGLTGCPFSLEATGLWSEAHWVSSGLRLETPQAPTITPTPPAVHGPSVVVSESEVLRGDSYRPYVALTFDADSSARPLELMLTTLRTKEISCTFFIQGSWAERFPEEVQAIVADGHEIGNHSYSHPDFRELNEEQIISELTQTEDVLLRLTGVSSKPFFRPPYSYRNELVRQVAAQAGYLTVVWTYDAFDWKRNSTEETIYQEIVGHAEPGAIYVQHVGDENSASVLGRVIDGLRAEGLEPVMLSKLLGP